MRQRLEEPPLELVNNRDDFISRFLQASNDGLELGKTNLIERYNRGKLNVHLHIRGAGESGNFCAVFQRNGSLVGGDVAFGQEPESMAYIPLSEHHTGSVRRRHHDEDGPMLVGVAEVANDTEGVMLRLHGDVVRLQALKECDGLPSDPLYLSFGEGGFSFLVGGLVEDREVEAGQLVEVANAGFLHKQTTDEMVQGRAQLVRGLSRDDAKAFRDTGLRGFYVKRENVLFGVGIVLLSDTVIQVIDDPSGKFRQLSDVLIGPLDLGPDAY